MDNVVSAERFELRNSAGRAIAVLAPWHDGRPLFQLFDSAGLQRVSLGIDHNDHPHISILNAAGQVLVGIGQNEQGVGLNVMDAAGMVAIEVAVHANGERELTVRGKDGQRLWTIRSHE